MPFWHFCCICFCQGRRGTETYVLAHPFNPSHLSYQQYALTVTHLYQERGLDWPQYYVYQSQTWPALAPIFQFHRRIKTREYIHRQRWWTRDHEIVYWPCSKGSKKNCVWDSTSYFEAWMDKWKGLCCLMCAQWTKGKREREDTDLLFNDITRLF